MRIAFPLIRGVFFWAAADGVKKSAQGSAGSLKLVIPAQAGIHMIASY